MMHRIKKSRLKFGSGILLSALVVFATVLVLSCTNDQTSLSTIDQDDKKSFNDPTVFSVVVDAGHGGTDDGGTHDHASEKDIVLGIVNAIRQLEVAPDIRLSFTRARDVTMPLKERVELANGSRPDLFLSLHVNSHPNKEPLGLEVYYSELNRDYRMSLAYSREFANTLGMKPTAIKSADFMVLKGTNCPAVLLNIGSMDNAGELAYLMKKENQQKIAREIVDTIVGISKMI